MGQRKQTAGNQTAGSANTAEADNKRTVGETSGKEGITIEENREGALVESPEAVTVEVVVGEGQKATVPRPRKKAKKKPVKEKDDAGKVKDIQGLIEGTFLLASLRFGQHWQVSPEESIQIAKPLSNILDRYDLLGKASQVSDPMALIVACAMITIPRVMITKMEMDSRKDKAKVMERNGAIDKKGNISGITGTASSSDKTTTTAHDGNFIKSLSNEVAGIVG